MVNSNKNLILVAFVFLQTSIALVLGLLSVYISKKDHVPPKVYINSISLGNTTRNQAIELIENNYALLDGFTVSWGEEESFIEYSEIDAFIDYQATIDNLYINKTNDRFLNFISNYFTSSKRVLYPVIKYDEHRLLDKIEHMALNIDRLPQDATLTQENKKVNIIPEKSGYSLNKKQTFDRISNKLKSSMGGNIELRYGEKYEITTYKSEITSEFYTGADVIIAEYTTNIEYSHMKEFIEKGSFAISGIKIPGRASGDLSFNSILKKRSIDINMAWYEYSQLASTLYAALLKSGISVEGIRRTNNTEILSYIPPGLDVLVDGNNDFIFKSTLQDSVFVISEVQDNRLKIYLVGNRRGAEVEREIKVKIIEEFEPSVLSIANFDLEPGEQRIISHGKNGAKVEVYRISTKKGNRIEEFLYTNYYEPVDAIIQIGYEESHIEGIK
ncbi:UNVERIFIED_CONTAM: vancomycin resistance protein YoaR [Acetivibrio alkalicellulosi]